MKVIRLILVGKSPCLRPPAPFRMACQIILVSRDGNVSLGVPVDDPWRVMEAGLAEFEPGFWMTREGGIAEGVPVFGN